MRASKGPTSGKGMKIQTRKSPHKGTRFSNDFYMIKRPNKRPRNGKKRPESRHTKAPDSLMTPTWSKGPTSGQGMERLHRKSPHKGTRLPQWLLCVQKAPQAAKEWKDYTKGCHTKATDYPKDLYIFKSSLKGLQQTTKQLQLLKSHFQLEELNAQWTNVQFSKAMFSHLLTLTRQILEVCEHKLQPMHKGALWP